MPGSTTSRTAATRSTPTQHLNSNLHAIEMAEGVVEAILDGIESTPQPQKKV
ncbi:hypothetical protein OO306_01645 [Pseudomonas sp. DCB_AW]|uniref:hypothetical protein n=1 Tax=Pseudomonas sp. DCB_AW TaxID=2993596 RepID=UPI002249619B|nr:hypothetical protein [Pseudomonas sp. DCB_AW]MCX2684252.1 hypothetical protein [Pseudomonas sp. DCB_AW]